VPKAWVESAELLPAARPIPAALAWRRQVVVAPAHFFHEAVSVHAAVASARRLAARGAWAAQAVVPPPGEPVVRGAAAEPQWEVAAWAGAVRPPEAAVARDAAAEPPPEVREAAVRAGAAVLRLVVAPAAEARQQAVLALVLVGPPLVVVSAFRRGQALLSARPAPRPAARFAHAMARLRIALP
jgi:hypothetical protein